MRLSPLRFDMSLSPANLLAFIRSHCRIDEDGCWRWRGRVQQQGIPVYSANRKQLNLRPLVMRLAGKDDPKRTRHLMRCQKADCLRPECMEPLTPGGVAKQLLKGKRRPADVVARAVAGRRAVMPSKLDMDKAREIRLRACAGERYPLIAAEFGVSKSTVHLVVSGRRWRDPSPWAGLA